MSKVVPWSIKGVDFDAREAAKLAARRAGMTLGDWMNSVITAYAREMGLKSEELDEQVRMDAIAARLARMAAGDEAPRRMRRNDRLPSLGGTIGGERAEAAIGEEKSPRARRPFAPSATSVSAREIGFDAPAIRSPRRREPDAESLLEAAIDALEDNGRAPRADAEEALDRMARRLSELETNMAPRARQDHDLLRESLARLEARIEDLAGSAPAAEPAPSLDETLRKVDRRIDEIASRLGGAERSRPAPAPERPDFERLEARLEEAVRRVASVPAQDSRLDNLERKIGEIAQTLSQASTQNRSLDVERIESKLNALLNRTTAEAAMAPAVAAAAARASNQPAQIARDDAAVPTQRSQRRALVHEAVAEIARHQRDLDTRNEAEGTALAGLRADISALAQRLEGMREELRREIAPRTDAAPAMEQLRSDIAGLHEAVGRSDDRSQMRQQLARVGEQIDALARASEAPRGPSPDVEILRAEIADLSHSLAGLAPRSDVSALMQEVHELAERIELSRESGIREGVLRPVEDLLRDLNSTLAELARRPATSALENELRAMSAKIEALSAQRVEPEDFQLILAQTAEIRDLLAHAAARPLPAETVGRQLAELGQRIDRLSQNHGRTGAFEIDLGVRNVRAALEELPGFSLVGQLGDRMEALGHRIDELSHRIDSPVAVSDPHALAHMEGISRKIDDVMERIGQAAPADTRELERIMREISAKLEQPAPAPDLKPLESLMTAIAVKLDRPPQIPQGGLNALEGMMREVAHKLESAAQGPREDVRALQETVATLSERIEEQSRATPGHDLEEVIRALAEKIDRVEHSTLAAQVPDETLVAMVRNIADRIEDVRAPQADTASFDALQAQIELLAGKIDRPSDSVPVIASLQASMVDLFGQLEQVRDAATDAARHAANEAVRNVLPGLDIPDSVTREIADLRSSQDASDRRMHATLAAVHETLEKVVDRLATIEGEMADVRPVAESSAIERAVTARSLRDEAEDDLLASGPAPKFERPAAMEAAAAPAPKARSAAAQPAHEVPLDDGFLIEPGSGLVPQRRADDAAAETRPDASSFIAAARRAVRANAAATAATPKAGAEGAGDVLSDVRERARAAAGSAAGKSTTVSALGGLIRDRRRPLLLSLAAVVVMLASLQAMRLYGNPLAPAAKPVVKVEPKAQKPPSSPLAVPATKAPAPQNGASLAPAKTGKSASAAPDANAKGKTFGSLALDPRPVGSIPAKLTAKAPTSTAADTALAPPKAANVTVASLPAATIMEVAKRGDRLAQYELGDRYAEGRGGLPRDMTQAAAWFQKAAEQHLAPAQYRLAVLFEKGLGRPRDVEAARKLYRQAAEAGNVRAMHNLAVLTADVGGDGKPDYATAAHWFHQAAEHGVRDSQYNLAILYARGLGVPQSFEKSYVWFGIAATQGDTDAGKKRDEIGDHLDAATIAKANATIQSFKPQAADVIANDVPTTPTWNAAVRPTAFLAPVGRFSKV